MKNHIAKEVKEEILGKVKAGEGVASLSEKYGVSTKTIYGWLRGKATHHVSWMEHIRLKKENQQLKEIIGVLSLEIEKSKKREVIDKTQARLKNVEKTLLFSTLGISRRNLYNQNTKQAVKDELLKEAIIKVLELNPSYGHTRVAMELKINKKRAGRVMKANGIKPYKRKARWTKKKDWGQPPSGYPNLIKGSCPIKPNVFWAGDFTRLIWNQKVVYLATFMDLFTREIVGWSISTRNTTELIVEASMEAISNFGLSKVAHTDQGREYKSKDYINLLEGLGVKVSHSAKAGPWENAYQESFYDNFKTDLGLEFERFGTPGEFIEAIQKTVNYYNQKRVHTKLKMSPARFKQKYLAQTV